MPLLDNDVLGALLHELGDSFTVPPSGAVETLRRVHGGDDERAETEGFGDKSNSANRARFVPSGTDPVQRRVGATIRAHRLLSAAACVVVVLALAGGAVRWEGTTGTPPRTSQSNALKLPPSATQQAKSASGGVADKSLKATTTTPPSSAFSTPGRPAASVHAPASGAATAPTPTSGGAVALPSGAVGQPARIEQTGSLNLTVARGTLTTSMAKLSALAATYNGFVANSQRQSGSSKGDPPSGTVSLQVPVENFDAVLTAAEALGHSSGLTTRATDVTAQYVDLQSRITALQASRQQYLTIMTKASSVGDVLAVQAQLDALQSKIEQLQGQLAVLDSETAYSTLTATLSEAGTRHHHVVTPSESGAAKAWHASVRGFAEGVDGIIRIAGPALFALLCLATLFLGGRLTWRRVQRHNL
jgi:hypothetical protein